MAKKQLLFIFGIFGIGAITLSILGRNRAKSYYADFDTSGIAGKLTFVGIVNHATGFKVNNQQHVFAFWPYTDLNYNEHPIFLDFAVIGDSVIKPSRSDRLILIHNNKRYSYYFRKIQ